MARIRSLHPRIFTDEHYASLSLAARELLKGVWCEAWDDGVIEWRPMRLKMRIFPLDQVDVEALLAELVREKFIMAFTVGNNEYAVIRNFRKWQKPKKPTASGVLPSSLREFIGLKQGDFIGKVDGAADAADESPGNHEADEVPSLFSIGTSPVDGRFRTGGEIPFQKGGREEGRKVIEGSLRSPSPHAAGASEAGTPSAPVREGASHPGGDDGCGFEAFWAAYPAEARTAPDYARRAYGKAMRLGATPERILGALRRDVERAGKRQHMAPAAWLCGGSWRVEANPVPEPSGATRAAAIDPRFEGWEISDHMELAKWRRARENAWRTRSADHNALPERERRAGLWRSIEENHRRVARFLAQHEPDGVPVEAAA